MERSQSRTLKSYIWGFIFCLILTLGAFYITANDLFTGWSFILALFALGLIQCFVQLVFFLHLGKESKPQRNLQIFLFMTLVLVVIVLGSLWIMYNLDYRMM